MIPYGRQSIDDSDVAAVVRVLRSDWLTQGPEVEAFENAFAAACGAPHAVAFSSGTAGLHAAAFAAGLGPGDELLTSAMTFAASANCGAYMGADVVFADIDPATWNVSSETVSRARSERTKVAVPVHYAGLPAPIEAIRGELGDQIVIVEDACHALGASDAGTPIGSCEHSDMTVFSLHPVKAIAAGEGGVVTTRDPELRERLAGFRSHGITRDPERLEHDGGPWYHEQQELGFNYRITDFQCALARSQLARLDSFIARRNDVAARYREALGGVGKIKLPPAASSGSVHAYHLFVVRFEDAETRLRVYEGLRRQDILPQVHYLPVYLHPYYRHRFGYRPGLCPAAEYHYETALSIPCFPTLQEAEQDQVITAIGELLES